MPRKEVLLTRTFTLPTRIIDKLENAAKELGVTKSFLIRILIDRHLDDVVKDLKTILKGEEE